MNPHLKHIVWTESARADVLRIDQANAMRILRALHRFAATSEGDVKHLQGNSEQLRLRVGNYRVRFVEKPYGTLTIDAVKHRSDAYR